MTPEQEAARGDRARQYVEDELVKEAFQTIHDALHSQWEYSSFSDKDGREAAYFMLRGFNEFKQFFANVISDGDFSKATIEKKLEKAIKGVNKDGGWFTG